MSLGNQVWESLALVAIFLVAIFSVFIYILVHP